MRITEQTSVREIREKAIRLYRIRMGSALGLIVTFTLAAKIGGFQVDLLPLVILGAIEIIFNCPYPIYFRDSESGFKFLAASVMTDFAVETLAIHFVGGIDAMFFSAIYLLSILYCAQNLPTFFNFLMATLASIFYAGLIAAEYYGVIPHRPTLGLHLSGVQQSAFVFSHIAFFYLIAIFARYLANALIDKEQRMAALFMQLRDAHQKVRYAHRMKSEFFAQMSHELRSPLNSIMSISQLLKEPEIGSLNPRQTGYVQNIEKNGKHLLELINDVLDISKIEAKKMQMDLSEVNLNELIRSTVDLFYEEALQHQVTLEFVVLESQTPITLHADAKKIRQILHNLISNAIKFTPKNGKVWVRLQRSDKEVRLMVVDSGVGIAPEDQRRIFDPYEQVGQTQTLNLTGTGLGLAITKRFVEMHQGKIKLRSRLGHGSEFMITFPLQQGSVQKSIPPAPEVKAA